MPIPFKKKYAKEREAFVSYLKNTTEVWPKVLQEKHYTTRELEKIKSWFEKTATLVYELK